MSVVGYHRPRYHDRAQQTVDGDGRPDLATANYLSNSVSVLLGNGDGTFQPKLSIPAGYHPGDVAVGDVNGDGQPDLVAANEGDGTVSVLLHGGPCLTVQPANGPVGQSITFSGANFGASERVNIYEDRISSTPAYTATTDTTGALAISGTITAAPHGPHALIGVGQRSGRQSSAIFTIKASLTLTPAAGSPGTVVTGTGTGFGATETVTLHWQGPKGKLLGSGTSDIRGSVTMAGTISSGSAPGTYTVFAVGARSLVQAYTTFSVT